MKKWIRTIGIIVFLFMLIKSLFAIRHNLITYSVYYAQHLEHKKDTDPVIAMVIDHLWDIPRPENQGLLYDFDGSNVVIDSYTNASIGGAGDRYSIIKNRHFYNFTGQGKFVESHEIGGEEDRSESRKKEAIKLAYELLQPVIDVQPQPPKYANLQWLFNITYGRRFQ